MTLKTLSDLDQAHIHISREATTRENELILEAWAMNIAKLTESRAKQGKGTNVLAVCHKITELWRGARGEFLYRVLRDKPEVRHALSIANRFDR